MTAIELITLSTQIHTQLYNHWDMFISIHIALLGGLFAFDLNVKTSFKFGFLLFYAIVAGINLGVSLNLMNQLYALTADLQALNTAAPTHIESYLLQREIYDKPILIIVHLITGIMVVAGLFMPSKNKASAM